MSASTFTVNGLDLAHWFLCGKCKHSFFVRRGDPELYLIDKKQGDTKAKTLRCPNYVTCQGTLRLKTLTKDKFLIHNARWVTALQLFQASAGIGLPEERECSVSDVRKAMTGARIAAVHLLPAPDPKKSLLLSLTLDSGKVFHVSTSTQGAIIYKVTQ